MTEYNSLINIGELSKPATVLIEKISSAVGTLYAPRHVRRMGDAQAYADKVAAETQLTISEIERRGIERLVKEEGRKQQNIENISSIAIEYLEDEASPEKIDDDWMVYFFEKARIVSDEQMQTLWDKVLAGESTSSGSVSKRTLEFLSTIDKNDAKLITHLCQFCWSIGELTPIILDVQHAIYNKQGINFDSLRHLNEIGILAYQTVGFKKIIDFKEEIDKHELRISYFGQRVNLSLGKTNQLRCGLCLLTKTGQEIAPICGAKNNEEFFQFFLDKLTKDENYPYSPVNFGL